MAIGGQTVYVNQAASGASVSSLASVGPAGIVNAASYSPPITAGCFISVYGQNLSGVITDWTTSISDGKLPTSIAGIQVLVNGKPAFINYVSPVQVNAIAPDTSSGEADVLIITPNGTVATTTTIAATSPALFTYLLGGRSYAVAQFATDYAWVAPPDALPGIASRSANAGDYVVLYATGLGTTNPPYPIGRVLDAAYPVSDLSKVTATIGGLPAVISYAGVTYPGVFQINVQVPNGVLPGDRTIDVRIVGQPSQPGVYLNFSGN